MAPNFSSGDFKIVSLVEGNPPASVLPTHAGFQIVHLNRPVTTWVVKKAGRNTCRLSIGWYPYTGVTDDKVSVSLFPDQDVEWLVTYHESQDAYTIAPANDPGKGWIVFFNPEDNSYIIEIKLITVQPSDPPRYSPPQLFRFVPVNDE